MNKTFSTKRLCRAAVIAALYTVLTYVFMPLAFGPFQIRPAEALCILPLFYVEAIPALAVGCMLSHLASPYLLYDVCVGSLTTLVAAFISYLVGRFIKKNKTAILLGGLPPVLLNAIVIPFIIVFLYDDVASVGAYFSYFFSLLTTQSIWVYGLGAPLYYAVKRLQSKKQKAFE